MNAQKLIDIARMLVPGDKGLPAIDEVIQPAINDLVGHREKKGKNS